jgi:hypothetical protein
MTAENNDPTPIVKIADMVAAEKKARRKWRRVKRKRCQRRRRTNGGKMDADCPAIEMARREGKDVSQ